MRRILLLVLMSLVSFVTVEAQNDWAQFDKYAVANTTVKPGAVAVFMGNSITEGWGNVRKDFFADNGYVCRGISGQTTSQMLVRFRADVINLKPKSVVILAGINDIAQNNGYISLENMFGNIVSMVELAKLHKIKVILCSVLPAYSFPWRPDINPAKDVASLNTLLKNYATAEHVTYVDYYSAMVDDRGGLSEKHAGDGIHPTIEGYKIMESIVKPVIDKTTKTK